MSPDAISPLRQRMIEDMTIRWRSSVTVTGSVMETSEDQGKRPRNPRMQRLTGVISAMTAPQRAAARLA